LKPLVHLSAMLMGNLECCFLNVVVMRTHVAVVVGHVHDVLGVGLYVAVLRVQVLPVVVC